MLARHRRRQRNMRPQNYRRKVVPWIDFGFSRRKTIHEVTRSRLGSIVPFVFLRGSFLIQAKKENQIRSLPEEMVGTGGFEPPQPNQFASSFKSNLFCS